MAARSVLGGLTPRRNDPQVLFDNTFDKGLGGFVQLMHDTRPIGVLGLDTDYTYDDSRHSMLLSTEDYAWGGTEANWKNWGQCTAIKRMSRGATLGRVKFDVWWAWGSLYGQNSPRCFNFGIDQADPDGNRKYFNYRWVNWLDDSGAGSRVTKWQVMTYSGGTTVWQDLTNGVQDYGYNENKRNLIHTEMVFDIDAGVYDGLRVNGMGIGGGSLSDGTGDPDPVNPSNPMRALGSPMPETLAIFKNGFNCVIDLINRQNITSTKSWMHVARAKAVKL